MKASQWRILNKLRFIAISGQKSDILTLNLQFLNPRPFDVISAVAERSCGSEASHVGPDHLGLFHRKRHLHIF